MITLEAPETVHAGEAITGRVHASGRARVFVRRTSIWRGPSRGGDLRDDRDVEGVTVNGDAPFTLPAVRGPLTHHGERVELEWSVVAESLDGGDRATVPFALVAPRTTTYEREAAGGYRDRPTETTTLEPDFGEQHVEGPRRPKSTDALDAFGKWMIRTFEAIMTATRSVGDLNLDVTPSRVRANEEIVATLSFATNEEIVVETITIQLAAREHWRLLEDRAPLIESRVETVSERARLAPGPHTYEARLRVPANAPPSFATIIGVEWFVRATIQVDGQTDAVTEYVIGVAPF